MKEIRSSAIITKVEELAGVLNHGEFAEPTPLFVIFPFF